MRKLLFSIISVAAAFAVTSCIHELAPGGDGGTPVNVSFSVDIPGTMTKAENTALDDASGVFQLYVAAFNASDGALLDVSRVGGSDYPGPVTLNGKTSVSLALSKGGSYKVVFFAEREGAYDVEFASGNKARFAYKAAPKANDGSLDAFFASVDVTPSATTYDVPLTRPFAQLNVLVPTDNVPDGLSSFSSSMSVKAPTAFDLYTGQATGERALLAFSDNGIDTIPFGKYEKTHKYVGMNYVLVPADGMVEVTSFQASGMKVPAGLGRIPVKMNGRTNLVGNLYALDFTASFSIVIVPEFGGQDEEVPIDGEDTEITLADGSTYADGSSLVIDAGEPKTVTLRLRVNGDSFSEVEENANGGKVKAVSKDPSVASVQIVGNDVVITPESNGETEITVTTPVYTKATYRSGEFVIPVEVKNMPEQPSGGAGDFVLVSDVSELQAGDEILIVYPAESVAMGAQNSDYRNPADVTISGDSISEPGDDVQIIVLEGSAEDGWRLGVGDGYLAATSTKQNYLRTVTELSDYAKWTIDFSEDGVMIYAAAGERNMICYNTGAPRFSCYAKSSGQTKLVSIYRRSGEDRSEEILSHTEPGAYLSDRTRSYAAGTDQYLREYDGNTLTFALLRPSDNEQMVISGFADTMQEGDAVSLSVSWKKGLTQVVDKNYPMSVVKVADRKVWIADKRGNGFIILK